MSEFQKYPLTMAHPAYTPAKTIPVPGTQRYGSDGVTVLSQDYQGTPQKFPPVQVSNEDEQEYYEAQGYQPAGKADPAAYATAHASAPPPDYVPIEYPKWVNGVLVDGPEDDPTHIAPEEAALDDNVRDYVAEIDRLRTQLAEATAPKNKGGRPRKVADEQPAA